MYKLYITLIFEIFKVVNGMMGEDNIGIFLNNENPASTSTNPFLDNENQGISLASTSTNPFLDNENQGISLASTSTNSESYNILPLILINTDGDYTAPNRMDAKNWITGTNPLSGKVEFSTNYHGDQVFLCKIKQIHTTASSSTPSNDDHCTYPIRFKSSNPLRCITEPEPYISKLKMKPSPIMIKDVSCGSWSKRGKIYRLVYQICMTKEPFEDKDVLFGYFVSKKIDIVKRFEFEIYRFCIDETDNTVMYTEHKISPAELLDSPKLLQERLKEYEMTIEENNPFKLSKENLESQYNNVEKYKDENEAYIETVFPGMGKPLFKPQKLVPPNDFAFALGRKATFNYLNGKRMKLELVAIWDFICQLIRDDAIKNKREYYIYTTVAELLPPIQMENLSTNKTLELSTNQADDLSVILQEPATKRARGESSRQPLENRKYFWMKKIYHLADEEMGKENANKETKAIAIMVDNNFDKDEYYEQQLNMRCGNNLCENVFNERYPEVGNFVRCCSLINNKLLQGIDGIEINTDLTLDLKDNEYNINVYDQYGFVYDDVMGIQLDLDLFNNYI